MSRAAVKWTESINHLSRSERAVMRYLAETSKRGAYVIASHKQIAEATDYGLRTIERVMANLSDMDMIVCESRFRKNGHRTASKIHLVMGRNAAEILVDHPPICRPVPPAKMAEPIEDIYNTAECVFGSEPKSPKLRSRIRRRKGLPGRRAIKARATELEACGADLSNVSFLARGLGR